MIERLLGVRTAALLVVASMVGTGVFTTTGFLVADLRSAPAVLACWLVGGVSALCGALAYAEVAAALPNNGGEYQLLGRIYSPALGFVAGIVSLFVGFAAPIAASAIAFGTYLQRVFPGGRAWWPQAAGVGLIVVASALHIRTVRQGSRAQDAMTFVKLLIIIAFVCSALPGLEWSRLGEGEQSIGSAMLSAPFAVGLVFVSFAYTGWNAAAYIAGETHDPGRNVPRALFGGTAVVVALYLALNVVFLGAVEPEALAGKVEVGHIAAQALFGEGAARLMSAIIAIGLVSTVGAMVLTGPRIYEAMGLDHPKMGALAKRRAGGGPVGATLLQAAVAIAMALSASFDALLIYVGVSLTLFSALTAAGVFVLRAREPELERPYRTWGHPFTTLLFLGLCAWMMIFSIRERPMVVAYAAGTLVVGFIAWLALGARPTSDPLG